MPDETLESDDPFSKPPALQKGYFGTERTPELTLTRCDLGNEPGMNAVDDANVDFEQVKDEGVDAIPLERLLDVAARYLDHELAHVRYAAGVISAADSPERVAKAHKWADPLIQRTKRTAKLVWAALLDDGDNPEAWLNRQIVAHADAIAWARRRPAARVPADVFEEAGVTRGKWCEAVETVYAKSFVEGIRIEALRAALPELAAELRKEEPRRAVIEALLASARRGQPKGRRAPGPRLPRPTALETRAAALRACGLLPGEGNASQALVRKQKLAKSKTK